MCQEPTITLRPSYPREWSRCFSTRQKLSRATLRRYPRCTWPSSNSRQTTRAWRWCVVVAAFVRFRCCCRVFFFFPWSHLHFCFCFCSLFFPLENCSCQVSIVSLLGLIRMFVCLLIFFRLYIAVRIRCRFFVAYSCSHFRFFVHCFVPLKVVPVSFRLLVPWSYTRIFVFFCSLVCPKKAVHVIFRVFVAWSFTRNFVFILFCFIFLSVLAPRKLLIFVFFPPYFTCVVVVGCCRHQHFFSFFRSLIINHVRIFSVPISDRKSVV